jgi:hypothetical protein
MGHTIFPEFLLAVFISDVVSSSTPTNLSHIFLFFLQPQYVACVLYPESGIHCQTIAVIY